ncbi:MAG: IS5 family transposase [Verrucomicrobiota bacterium]
MTHQPSFSQAEFADKKKVTRREKFLTRMEAVIPWAKLLTVIEPFYPKGERGCPHIGLERMLRVYFLQQWYGLADEALEDAIYDSKALQGFARIELAAEGVPDATTLLKFRRLLETHDLCKGLFAAINADLSARGLLLRAGTLVEATLIAAPPSTKNKDKQRDPEMRQTKKGNQWYFGMKAHIGADRDSKLVHSGTYTNSSGRNDIIASKVALDVNNVYFWVQTAANLSAYTGSNWMHLLLDVDGDHSNGWNGYDFIVNRSVVNATTTTLKRYADNVTWNIPCQISGNQMMLAVPRTALGLISPSLAINFHWVDNCPANVGSDIVNFWTTGDSAPDGRFNYRYISQCAYALSLLNPYWGSNAFTVSVPSTKIISYELQYKNVLTDATWTALPAVSGNDGTLTLTNVTTGAGQRFYRVLCY